MSGIFFASFLVTPHRQCEESSPDGDSRSTPNPNSKCARRVSLQFVQDGTGDTREEGALSDENSQDLLAIDTVHVGRVPELEDEAPPAATPGAARPARRILHESRVQELPAEITHPTSTTLSVLRHTRSRSSRSARRPRKMRRGRRDDLSFDHSRQALAFPALLWRPFACPVRR